VRALTRSWELAGTMLGTVPRPDIAVMSMQPDRNFLRFPPLGPGEPAKVLGPQIAAGQDRRQPIARQIVHPYGSQARGR
jgi:hypothetical protein